MKAVFIELPAFERNRAEYLDDAAFSELQQVLMKNPEAGEVIEGTGGLRKMRFADARRGKGKRGGLRVIYYWWRAGLQFWLYTPSTPRRCMGVKPPISLGFRAAELTIYTATYTGPKIAANPAASDRATAATKSHPNATGNRTKVGGDA